MATKEFWEIDPWDEGKMWLRVVGHPEELPEESRMQAGMIFGDFRGGRCIEIGAGVGRLLKFAANHFNECYGVDYSVPIVALSTRYLQGTRNCRVVLTDGTYLPFGDETFDFVYSFTCFQHMPNLGTIQVNLKEAFRVLRQGGMCRIQTVQGNPDPDYYDGRVFPSPQEFGKEFEAAGFEVIEAKTINAWIWLTAKKPFKFVGNFSTSPL